MQSVCSPPNPATSLAFHSRSQTLGEYRTQRGSRGWTGTGTGTTTLILSSEASYYSNIIPLIVTIGCQSSNSAHTHTHSGDTLSSAVCFLAPQRSSTWSAAATSSQLPAWGDASAHEQVRAANTHTNNQINKQTNERTNKQTDKQTEADCEGNSLTLCSRDSSPHSKRCA